MHPESDCILLVSLACLQILPPSFHHHLLRPSESIIHLCSIPSSTSIESSTSSPSSTDKNAILQSGLDILEPLKSQCLFRTIDWFTYSFCHGTEVRQFRALPGTNGPHGTPAADPTQESYILGRFTPNSEKIYPDKDSKSNGGDKNHLVSSQSHTTATLGSTSSSDTNVGKEKSKEQIEGGEEEDGAELVEVLRFSSSGDQDDLAERYLSQKWGGGTRCDITMEPRETEVQVSNRVKAASERGETGRTDHASLLSKSKLYASSFFDVGFIILLFLLNTFDFLLLSPVTLLSSTAIPRFPMPKSLSSRKRLPVPTS